MKLNAYHSLRFVGRRSVIGRSVMTSVLLIGIKTATSMAVEPSDAELQYHFAQTVRPFLKTFCHDCHGRVRQEAELKLSDYESIKDVTGAHHEWGMILARLESQEMPPEESKRQPDGGQRQAVIDWIHTFRQREASRNSGDPGLVLARRLTGAEFNYTIRDLTGVDIRPAASFPVDPANEAGFDNSGESLAMSPTLLKKYLDATRQVVEHLVLKPDGFAFAPHPVVTNTDRDKYCVKRIVEFYQQQPTDYADYFLAAWRFKNREATGNAHMSLADVAAASGVSSKYLTKIWSTLVESKDDVGPIAKLQAMWRELPAGQVSTAALNGDQNVQQDTNLPHPQYEAVRLGCEKMRDFIVELRRKLEPRFKNLTINGSHKGSQPFVLWKNRQYAAHRMNYHRGALRVLDHRHPDAKATDDLMVPADPTERARYDAALERFCAIFPDTFYVSERGRDYLDTPKEQQEQGRLLSAGFHSMMGYFRDDDPLYELILDSSQQRRLDVLWQELDFITSAPMRQYSGFLWFERTDSRFMRDAEFDFARAEDKNATSAAMIERLARIYLAKSRRNGGDAVAIEAIEDYFRNINAQIRWVEQARLAAQSSHLEALLEFAAKAYRRQLSPTERENLIAFYHSLRSQDGLSHDEAMQDSIVSILMSPFFCYRMDLASAGDGQRALTQYELASRLSYFIWSSMPDQPLLDRAAAGELRRHEVLVEQTRRMLQDQRIRRLATEFGGHWLDFRRFEEHNSVDRKRFPEFTDDLRMAMFEEPIRFFVDLCQNDRSLLDFLDADHTFVNRTLAEHYDMPFQSRHDALRTGHSSREARNNNNERQRPGQNWIRVDGASQYDRGGLMPMSVFLTKNSPGLRTSPVQRGYWVVRRLLGERIPPPPPNVPELPGDETKLGDLTLRELLARHREHKSCAGCHARFDAIGLVFEGYGPIGQRREKDLGGRPVSTTATLPGGGQASGLDGLRIYLREHRQDEYLENLCRKMLSYALGRTLQLSDDPLVHDLRAKLAADGYRFSILVETIVTSPQFLNKRGRTQLVQQP